jgi:AmmeMemoRadiSam system protein B
MNLGCALPSAQVLETPLGALYVDAEIVASLKKTGLFSIASLDVEEAEHSIEMQLPFIKHIYKEYFMLVFNWKGVCLSCLSSSVR